MTSSVDSTPEAALRTARLARSFYRMSLDGTDQESVRVPGAAVDELISGLADAVRERICQIVPLLPDRWRPQAFSQLVWRDLARQGRKVQRLYLVPSGHGRAGQELVNHQLTRDKHSQFECGVLPVSGVAEPTRIPMNDVWLIDDRVVVRQELAGDGALAWVVSVRPNEVAAARELWDRLWQSEQRSVTETDLRPLGHGSPELTYSLLMSANMMRTVAPMSCTRDYIDEQSCAWYHGVWQYLRLFDMVSSPAWHADFYHDALGTLINKRGGSRVLIYGAADYSMLAYLLAARGGASASDDLDIRVLGRCQTPLLSCQWYASRVGVPVTLHQVDIRQDDAPSQPEIPEATADLIVADGFLTRFSRCEVGAVLKNWARLLRPGGAVVTTIRLHSRNSWPSDGAREDGLTGDRVEEPTDSTGALTLVSDAVTDFALRLRQRADGWQRLLGTDIDDLCDAARTYALRITSNDIGDVADVAEAFDRAGFVLDPSRRDPAKVDGELVPTEYLRIVAYKK
jgi:SAM-dependent methyltransferase